MSFAVLGSGMMGRAAALDLSRDGEVTLVDRDPAAVRSAKAWLDEVGDGRLPGADPSRIVVRTLDPTKGFGSLRPEAVLSALPYHANPKIARECVKRGLVYGDLGGNDAVTRGILDMSKKARKGKALLVPDMGLAPGLAPTMGYELHLRGARDITLMVGGLPQHPKNELRYALVFSSEGLLNEYLEPVQIVEQGRLRTVETLGRCRKVRFPGLGNLEACSTSGGLSTLGEDIAGEVSNLEYLTLRYPGHFAILRSMRELGFFEGRRDEAGSPRAMAERLFKERMPHTDADLIAFRVESEKGRWTMLDKAKGGLTAMMRCTVIPATRGLVQLCGAGKSGAMAPHKALELDGYVKSLKASGLPLRFVR